MFSAIRQLFSNESNSSTIGFWGSDVAELTTLVHALQTGQYAAQQASIHPVFEEISIDGSRYHAFIPSGNVGSRRSFEGLDAGLVAYVFVVEPIDLEASREELQLLVEERGVKPILVLATSSRITKESIGFEAISQKAAKIGFFSYSASTNDVSGAQRGLQWLKEQL